MLQKSLRAPVTRIITPVCRGLLSAGFTANSVSAIGAVGTVFSAIFFYSRGKFFVGTLVTVIFILSDLLDGTMARLSQKNSQWGALLDSTLDRISDAAVLGSVAYYLSKSSDPLVPVVLMAIVAGSLVSYIKARAESLDIPCNGGFAERTERLIIAFVSIGLAGLSISYVLSVGMWALASLSIITCIERLLIVYKGSK
jgi:CDP-diacylglycerol--glycerol-3-phosphate 3-phosphatidyltransferase